MIKTANLKLGGDIIKKFFMKGFKMVVALTGHVKIEKALSLPVVDETLRTYNEEAYEIAKKDIFNALKKEIPNIENEDVIFVSGMARGGDEIFADIAIELNKKLILCVPDSIKWHKRQKKSAIKYDEILAYGKADIREIKKTTTTEITTQAITQEIKL